MPRFGGDFFLFSPKQTTPALKLFVALLLTGLFAAVEAIGLNAVGVLTGNFTEALLSGLPNRIFGIMANETLVAVPLFVFMGVMLERSKVAEELLEAMGRLFGQLRGGLGLSVTIVGALLAASTGIVGATVVTMGMISLPTMLKRGYDPKLATGAISAAGTLGQIIPPSIVLVLLGDVISTGYQQAQLEQGIFSPETMSVGDLFAGALVPGLMLVGLYMSYQVMMAIFRPESSPALPADDITVEDAFAMTRIQHMVESIHLGIRREMEYMTTNHTVHDT